MREIRRRRFAVGFAPRLASWWLLVVACVTGAVMTVYALWPGVETFPAAALWALGFTLPLVVGWWWLLRLPQLWSRIARSGAIAAILWGATAAAGICALPANGALFTTLGQRAGVGVAHAWGAALIAPVTEETAKALGIVVVLLAARQRLRTPMDAALLGAFSAVGFTATEDILYALNIAFLNLGENQAISTTVIYLMRAVIFGPASHVVFTATVGAGIGVLAKGRRRGRLPLGLALVAFGAGLHFVWNTPWLDSLWSRFAFLLVVPFLMWLLLRYLRTEEQRWFLEVLGRQGALGVIPEAYVAAVGKTWWKRHAYRSSVVKAFGAAAMEPQRALEAELTDLADAVDVGDDAAAASIRASLESRLITPS